MAKRLRLGELLIKKGFIDEGQLKLALQAQLKEGGRLGEVLVKLGLVTEENIVKTLALQLNIPYGSKAAGLLNPARDQELDKLLPADFARKNLVLPLSKKLNSLTCAIADPLDVIMIDNLKRITGCEINPIIATQSDIVEAIEEFYGRDDLLKSAIKASYDTEQDFALKIETVDEERLNLDRLVAEAEKAPVIKLVDLLIRQAIRDRASDIHIEPFKDKVTIRFRIDGMLCEIPPPAKHLILPLISRIKILSKLDIAEKRLPQDGGFAVRMEDKAVDLRVSTAPTIYGEKVVMRILDKSAIPLDLNQLGFSAKALDDFKKAIHRLYGLVFLTGPTGSGKTTTLYAVLNEIKTSQKNLITIEDPVEYRLEGINQIQIKPEIGLTFANGLRSFVRQDPDVIMVGEVRDLETAQICVQAALTGHLVLSTLHTNDASSAITRLVDIGIEPYLIIPSLILVVAQRLIRKLCLNCKEAYEPTREILEKTKIKPGLLYRAKGCEKCKQTGYYGRTGLYEVMVLNKPIRELIAQGAQVSQFREAARNSGMRTLWECGLEKVEAGITSLEEVMSVTLAGQP